MLYRRILTVQDISCVGQCSITVALPVISACGHETCILPSAILSTHTTGFEHFTVHDLTDEFPKIIRHWQDQEIRFDAVYTGYICNVEQIGYVEEIISTLLAPGGKVIVDPAMADSGKLYPGFAMSHVLGMKKLCSHADVVLPNRTEACLLTGREYMESISEQAASELIEGLHGLGAKAVVLTGVSLREGKTGVLISDGETVDVYQHELLPKHYHGTGDVFASAFTGAYMQGCGLTESARIASGYVTECVRCTMNDPEHWYGVKFEKALPELTSLLQRSIGDPRR